MASICLDLNVLKGDITIYSIVNTNDGCYLRSIAPEYSITFNAMGKWMESQILSKFDELW